LTIWVFAAADDRRALRRESDQLLRENDQTVFAFKWSPSRSRLTDSLTKAAIQVFRATASFPGTRPFLAVLFVFRVSSVRFPLSGLLMVCRGATVPHYFQFASLPRLFPFALHFSFVAGIFHLWFSNMVLDFPLLGAVLSASLP
jgi:hypothetical protein